MMEGQAPRLPGVLFVSVNESVEERQNFAPLRLGNGLITLAGW
jgi:hypothetical protein